jgi:hypothetical protein
MMRALAAYPKLRPHSEKYPGMLFFSHIPGLASNDTAQIGAPLQKNDPNVLYEPM